MQFLAKFPQNYAFSSLFLYFSAIFYQKIFEIFRILKIALRKDKDFSKKYTPMQWALGPFWKITYPPWQKVNIFYLLSIFGDSEFIQTTSNYVTGITCPPRIHPGDGGLGVFLMDFLTYQTPKIWNLALPGHQEPPGSATGTICPPRIQPGVGG